MICSFMTAVTPPPLRIRVGTAVGELQFHDFSHPPRIRDGLYPTHERYLKPVAFGSINIYNNTKTQVLTLLAGQNDPQ